MEACVLMSRASGTRPTMRWFRRPRTGRDNRMHISKGEPEMAPDQGAWYASLSSLAPQPGLSHRQQLRGFGRRVQARTDATTVGTAFDTVFGGAAHEGRSAVRRRSCVRSGVAGHVIVAAREGMAESSVAAARGRHGGFSVSCRVRYAVALVRVVWEAPSGRWRRELAARVRVPVGLVSRGRAWWRRRDGGLLWGRWPSRWAESGSGASARNMASSRVCHDKAKRRQLDSLRWLGEQPWTNRPR